MLRSNVEENIAIRIPMITKSKLILVNSLISGVLCHGAHSDIKRHEGHISSTAKEPNLLSMLVNALEAGVFRFNAYHNVILATITIQLIPVVMIMAIPILRSKNLEGTIVLPLLIAFALGTLLGDIFIHLIPESFASLTRVSNGSQIIGCSIIAGFVFFLVLDKSLRILSNDSGLMAHSHEHSQVHSSDVNDVKDGKTRKIRRLSAYLNLITGLIHHITDGIGLATAFYSSAKVGVITTVAVCLHEIPHEIGDFAILLSSGFSFCQALKAQFIGAIGALVGAIVGCHLNETSSHSVSVSGELLLNNILSSYLGHDIKLSELMLPITTGGFIYIAAEGIVPTLLESNASTKTKEMWLWSLQVVFLAGGVQMMNALAH